MRREYSHDPDNGAITHNRIETLSVLCHIDTYAGATYSLSLSMNANETPCSLFFQPLFLFLYTCFHALTESDAKKE